MTLVLSIRDKLEDPNCFGNRILTSFLFGDVINYHAPEIIMLHIITNLKKS